MNYLLLHLHSASVLFVSPGKYGQENLFFHCSSPPHQKKKKKQEKTQAKEKSVVEPVPLAPPSLFSHGWSFQTIGCVHRGINGFCEASQPVEGREPSSKWGTAGLPLLVTAWVFECVFVCVHDSSSWPLQGSEVASLAWQLALSVRFSPIYCPAAATAKF